MAKYSNNQERLSALQSANKWFLITLMVLSIVGCGHGIDSSENSSTPATLNVMGVDGPLANAEVNVYKLKDYLENYDAQTDVRTTSGIEKLAVASGTSDDSGFASGLEMSSDSGSGPFLVEFTSVLNETTDLTTDAFPVIETVRTIITENQYGSDQPRFYATALTTLAVDLLTNQNLTVDTIDLELGMIAPRQSVKIVLDGLAQAANDVKSLYGFGLHRQADFNLFSTPPVFDESTVDDASQDSAAAYRTALETFAVLVTSLKDGTIDNELLDTNEKVIAHLQSRLADGFSETNDSIRDEVKAAIATDLTITDSTIQGASYLADRLGDRTIQALMDAELGDISILIDSVAPAYDDPDSDLDGSPDDADWAPFNGDEDADTDADGTGDNADADADADGINDTDDVFPLNNLLAADPDNDGVDSGGAAAAGQDNCPLVDNAGQLDTDGDLLGDACDDFPSDANLASDPDGDSVDSGGATGQPQDNCPLVANGVIEDNQSDADGDLVGDACDAFENDPAESVDSDGDGVGDNADAFPTDSSETADQDGDRCGDNLDVFDNDPTECFDADGDGVGDNSDPFPNDGTETVDTDGDFIGNNADPDDDNDGVNDIDDQGNVLDACPLDDTETKDSDGDGVCDNSDPCIFEVDLSCPSVAGEELVFNLGPDCSINTCHSSGAIYGKSEIYFETNGYTLIATAASTSTTDAGTVASQVSNGIGSSIPAADTSNKWLINEGEKVKFTLKNTQSDQLVNFKNIKFSVPNDAQNGLTETEFLLLRAGGNAFELQGGDTSSVTEYDSSTAIDAPGWVDQVTSNFSLEAKAGNTGTAFRVASLKISTVIFDRDEDGVYDPDDAFPSDPLENKDTDGDAVGDNADIDADNDGVNDFDAEGNVLDACPLDATESIDSDGDGVCDVADEEPNDPAIQFYPRISVMGVDGPMANAVINVYKLQDYLATTTSSLASAMSDNLGFADGLLMTGDSSNGPFVVEVSTEVATIDTTTGAQPVIGVVKTIVTEEQYGGDQARFYATPLTTLAVAKAIEDANTNASDLTDPLVLATTLDNAQANVKALFGFGLLDNVDLFATPPVLDESTADNTAQTVAVNYRVAAESLAAVVRALIDPEVPALDTAEKVMGRIQSDLNDNGVNDDMAIFNEIEAVVATDLTDSSSSYLAGRIGSSAILTIMDGELGSIAALLPGVIAPSYGSPDSDNDGASNDIDEYDQDPTRISDFIDLPLNFNFNGSNVFSQASIVFVSDNYTLTISAQASTTGTLGTLATQTAYGLGSKAGAGGANWKISETEQINFSLTDSTGQAVNFKDITFTMSGWPTANGDQAIIRVNGIDYVSALIPSGQNDGNTGINGNWSDQEASSFSLTPSSPGSEIRIKSLSVTARVAQTP